jgi:hypothetical protein
LERVSVESKPVDRVCEEYCSSAMMGIKPRKKFFKQFRIGGGLQEQKTSAAAHNFKLWYEVCRDWDTHFGLHDFLLKRRSRVWK